MHQLMQFWGCLPAQLRSDVEHYAACRWAAVSQDVLLHRHFDAAPATLLVLRESIRQTELYM
jgi:hypothetical protein